jgi:cytochrome P450
MRAFLNIGRHRCIGEAFAFVQIKTLACMLLREFVPSLVKDEAGEPRFPKSDYTSLITMPEKPAYIMMARRNE